MAQVGRMDTIRGATRGILHILIMAIMVHTILITAIITVIMVADIMDLTTVKAVIMEEIILRRVTPQGNVMMLDVVR